MPTSLLSYSVFKEPTRSKGGAVCRTPLPMSSEILPRPRHDSNARTVKKFHLISDARDCRGGGGKIELRSVAARTAECTAERAPCQPLVASLATGVNVFRRSLFRAFFVSSSAAAQPPLASAFRRIQPAVVPAAPTSPPALISRNFVAARGRQRGSAGWYSKARRFVPPSHRLSLLPFSVLLRAG